MIMIEAFSNRKDGRGKKNNTLEPIGSLPNLSTISFSFSFRGAHGPTNPEPAWAQPRFGPYIRVRPLSEICACLIFGLGLD